MVVYRPRGVRLEHRLAPSPELLGRGGRAAGGLRARARPAAAHRGHQGSPRDSAILTAKVSSVGRRRQYQQAASPPVVVDNNGAPAPTGLAATVASSTTDAIKLSWVNPPTPPAAIAARWSSSASRPVRRP